MRRAFAALLIAGTAALGAGMILTSPHASAQGIPNKSCIDPARADQVAQPGDTITCKIFITGIVANGTSFQVKPQGPTGAFIPLGGCTGVSAGSAPFTYTTTASDNGSLGSTDGVCIFTVSTGAIGIGNNQIGTEQVTIPAATTAGTSVTQQAKECLPVVGCGPFTPMGVSGPGSCVGGTAIPVLGGCAPALPGGSPSPTPAASSSSPTPTSQVQAASTTPFTGGPDHPFPLAATAMVLTGAALGTAGFIGPFLIRKRRREDPGSR